MGGRAKGETQPGSHEPPRPPCSKFEALPLAIRDTLPATVTSTCRQIKLLIESFSVTLADWDNVLFPVSHGPIQRELREALPTPSPQTTWEAICTDVHQKTKGIQAPLCAFPVTWSALWMSVIQPGVPVFRLVAVILWSYYSLALLTGSDITLAVLERVTCTKQYMQHF